MLIEELHTIIQKKIFGISRLLPEQQNLLKELTYTTLTEVYYDILPFTNLYNFEAQLKVANIENFNVHFEKQEDINILLQIPNTTNNLQPHKINKVIYSKFNADDQKDKTQLQMNLENITSIQYPGLAIKKDIMAQYSLLDDNFLITFDITPTFCNILENSDINFNSNLTAALVTKQPTISSIFETPATLNEVPFPQDCLQLIIKKFEILTTEIFPTAIQNAKQIAEQAYEQALKRWQRSKIINQNFAPNKKKYTRPY